MSKDAVLPGGPELPRRVFMPLKALAVSKVNGVRKNKGEITCLHASQGISCVQRAHGYGLAGVDKSVFMPLKALAVSKAAL